MRVRINTGRKSSVLGGVITIVFLSIFVFVGISIMIGGVSQIIGANKSSDAYERITATVSDIQSMPDSDGDGYTYKVYVDYTYNGQQYSNIYLNMYSSDMYEGGDVKVMVDKNNPSRIKGELGSFGGGMLIAFGAVFVLIPGIIMIVTIKGMIRGKDEGSYIKKNGRQINAVVEDIVAEPSSPYASVKLYRVFCTYDDVGRNTIYRFVSDVVGEEVNMALSPGMTVPVFVNDRDCHDYYVDLSMYGQRKVVDLTHDRSYYR